MEVRSKSLWCSTKDAAASPGLPLCPLPMLPSPLLNHSYHTGLHGFFFKSDKLFPIAAKLQPKPFLPPGFIARAFVYCRHTTTASQSLITAPTLLVFPTIVHPSLSFTARHVTGSKHVN